MTTTERGHGRGSCSSESQQKTKSKKTLQDYAFYIGLAKQASDHNAVAKFLINHICKMHTNGNDVTNALEDGKTVDANTWKLSWLASAKSPITKRAQCNAKTKECKILYKAEVDSWI